MHAHAVSLPRAARASHERGGISRLIIGWRERQKEEAEETRGSNKTYDYARS